MAPSIVNWDVRCIPEHLECRCWCKISLELNNLNGTRGSGGEAKKEVMQDVLNQIHEFFSRLALESYVGDEEA